MRRYPTDLSLIPARPRPPLPRPETLPPLTFEIPPWVPTAIVSAGKLFFLSQALAGQDSDDDRRDAKRVELLLTGENMRAVWCALTKHKATPEQLEEFFRWAWWMAQYAERSLQRSVAITAADRDALALEIQKTAKKLRQLIKHARGRLPLDGSALDDLVTRLDGLELLVTSEATSLLERLVPRGVKRENAARTYYVRILSARLRREFGQPLHQVVATVTNAMFVGSDEKMDAGFVGKLTHDVGNILARKPVKPSARK